MKIGNFKIPIPNLKKMAKIFVNKNSYSGRSLVINNNRIIIDGVDVTPEIKQITISVEGDVDELKVSACNTIKISGNANSVSTQSGDVEVEGNVMGSVNTMSGDVSCKGNIHGNTKTMSGDITFKR